MPGREVSMKRLLLLSFAVLLSFSALADPAVTSLEPAFGPTTGGTEVIITGTDLFPHIVCALPCPSTVTFGDVTVEAVEESATWMRVITPPHAPGTADVRVTVSGEEPVRLPGAFTYQATPEDAYEQVLLPVYLDGIVDGAGGSRWATDFWMRNNGPNIVIFAPYPCPDGEACPAVIPLTTTLPPGRSYHGLPPNFGRGTTNPSRLFYLSNAGASQVSMGLRFADLSQGTLNGGTDLPVIRESEVLTNPAQLFNVPLNNNFRVLLRVYDVAHTASMFRVSLYRQDVGEAQPALHSFDLSVTTPQIGPFRTEAAYAQFDVTSLLALDHVQWPETVRIEITPLSPGSRFWAFASVTNNTTNLVTLVTPQ
jgi:IPT/TIG domain